MMQLMLPVFLHGVTRDVKRAAKHAASRVAKGDSIAELADEFLDAATMPGVILFHDQPRMPEAHLTAPKERRGCTPLSQRAASPVADSNVQ
jgi:hypothetical protein